MMLKERKKIGKRQALVFGLTCYILHWVVFLYMMGFLINFVVPKTIDIGGSPIAGYGSLIINLAIILAFVISHWVMAQNWFKSWWTQWVPIPIERSTFVLVSSVVLGASFYLWSPITHSVWEVNNPTFVVTLYVIYWLGWALAIYATFPINHWDLFGVRQVVLYYYGIPYTEPTGYDSIVYKLLPHPIFIGYAIVVWATPHMSVGHILLAGLLSVFLVVDVWLSSLRPTTSS